jgi:hypothetical protein
MQDIIDHERQGRTKLASGGANLHAIDDLAFLDLTGGSGTYAERKGGEDESETRERGELHCGGGGGGG